MNTPEGNQSTGLNPVIALWEKLDSRIRFGIILFLFILVAVSVSLIRTKSETASNSQQLNGPSAGSKAAAEEDKFHGAYVEWENGPVDVYITNFVMNDEVLIGIRNCLCDKQILIKRIGIQFMGEGEKIIDEGFIEIDRQLEPLERTGLISFKTKNLDNMDRAFKNDNTRLLKVDVSIKQEHSKTVSIHSVAKADE